MFHDRRKEVSSSVILTTGARAGIDGIALSNFKMHFRQTECYFRFNLIFTVILIHLILGISMCQSKCVCDQTFLGM